MNTERLHEFKCRTQGPTRMMMMMLRCCCLLKKMLLLFLLIAIASLVSTFLHQASSITTTFPLVYEQQHTSSIAHRNSHDQSSLSDDTRSKPAHQFQGHPKTLAMLQAPLARRKLLQHHHNKALLHKTTTMKKESAGNQQGGENKGYQRHGGRLELQRRDERCHELLLRIQSSSNDHHQAAAAADDLQRLHCAVIRSSLRVQALRKRAVLRSQPAAAAVGSKVVAAAGGFEAPVSASNGEYITTVTLGTPGRVFSVIVDTGSDLTWVQCSPCSDCYPQNQSLFSPSMSTSYSKLPCNSALCTGLPFPMCNNNSCVYWYAYGDGSLTTGDFVYDTITLDITNGQQQQVPDFAFGCGHDNEGSFAGAAGILGLGQGPLSFPSQLTSIFQGKFSYCLVDWQAAPNQTSPLLFGEAAAPLLPGVTYIGLVTNPQNPTFYYVNLTGISVGTQLLTIPEGTFDINPVGAGGAIFDSGTTITTLAEAAYTAVLNAMNTSTMVYPRTEAVPGLDLCFAGSNAQLPNVPTLTFHFEGADMVLPVSNYFIFIESSQAYCLSISQSPDMTVLGSIQQQNFQVLYDTVNRQIGFVPRVCTGVTL